MKGQFLCDAPAPFRWFAPRSAGAGAFGEGEGFPRSGLAIGDSGDEESVRGVLPGSPCGEPLVDTGLELFGAAGNKGLWRHPGPAYALATA